MVLHTGTHQEGQIPYHMNSPLTGIQSTKEKSKQNITSDIEIKNNVTMARGAWGGASGEKGFQELL